MAVHSPVPDLREGEGDVMHKHPPRLPECGSKTVVKILLSTGEQRRGEGRAGPGLLRGVRWEKGNSLGVQGSTGGVERGPSTNQTCPSCAPLHRQHRTGDCVCSPNGQSQVQATARTDPSEVSQKGCLLWARPRVGVRAEPCHGLAGAATGLGRGQGRDAPRCLESALCHSPRHQKQLSTTVTMAARCWMCSGARAGHMPAVCFPPLEMGTAALGSGSLQAAVSLPRGLFSFQPEFPPEKS